MLRPWQMRLLASISFIAMSSAAHATDGDAARGAATDPAADQSGNSILVRANQIEPTSAPYRAPTVAPLDAMQPTSIIGADYISKNIPMTSNYDAIVGIAPGVYNTSQNGSAGSDGNIRIRGFSNGQYNTTFDGIPFRIYTLTYRSSVFFSGSSVGQVTIDRGPGTASTTGDATFGGTIAIQSTDPANVTTITPYASVGSFNTFLGGARFDTGAIDSLNGGKAMFSAERSSTDGYVTNSHGNKTSVFGKYIQPLGNATDITVFATYNQSHEPRVIGATADQIAKFGPNYGFSTDPSSSRYENYNAINYKTDLEYVKLHSTINGKLTVDAKLYSFAYMQYYTYSKDPIGTAATGTSYSANDIPGYYETTTARSYGGTFDVAQEIPFGDVKLGVWADHQIGARLSIGRDLTLGALDGAAYIDPQNSTATRYNMRLGIDTIQPYFETDLKLLPNLVITAGVKYDYVHRWTNAIVNQTVRVAVNLGKSWEKALPSIALNYKLSDKWAVYAQAAQGFLAPPPTVLYGSTADNFDVKPQTSWNYQAGTSYQSHGLSISGDVYWIDFDNMINTRTVAGLQEFYNNGGVTYKGIEGEATINVGAGFSLYANGSIGSAISKTTNKWIAGAPNGTAAAGIIYNRNQIYLSLLDKWVGRRYAQEGQNLPLQPFNTMNASVGYDFLDKSGKTRLKARLQVENILNDRKIVELYQTSSSGTPLYTTHVGRAVSFSLSAPIRL